MLLGLSVAAQYYLTGILSFNALFSQLAVGSLINLFLILATLMCGFLSGTAIATIVPFISFAIGRMPHFWLIPFVALGNVAMVFAFWQICKKEIFGASFTPNWIVSSLAGTVLKFAVLYFGVTKIFVNFILVNDAALKAPQIEKMAALISFNYSLPQIATALIGCLLVYAIYPIVKKIN